MGSRLAGSILAILALIASAPVLQSQTGQPAASAKTQAAASTPDLSGIWTRIRGVQGFGASAPSDVVFTPGVEPPMTPWAEAKYKTNFALFRGPDPNTVLNDPIFSCFPPGVPRIYLLHFPVQIVQTPSQVIMLFEYDHFIRRIYTDGRGHSREQGPTWMGDSIGKWDGDTLVADTVGFNDKTLIDRVGHPHSEQLHVVERFRRVDHDNMEIELTIEDPIAFTKPWGTTLKYQLRPDWNIMEMVCEDNAEFVNFNKKAVENPAK